MKIYLAYDKDTKVYKGNEHNKSTFKKKKDKLYQNCECIEYDFDKWMEFVKTNPEIIKIEAGELKSEKRVRTMLELKNNALDSRKAYLRQTGLKWGDDWDSCPQEIKDKRKKFREEMDLISNLTTKEEVEKYVN